MLFKETVLFVMVLLLEESSRMPMALLEAVLFMIILLLLDVSR